MPDNLVEFFMILAEAPAPIERLLLKGLDQQKDYMIMGENRIYGGDELMNVGACIPEMTEGFQGHVGNMK